MVVVNPSFIYVSGSDPTRCAYDSFMVIKWGEPKQYNIIPLLSVARATPEEIEMRLPNKLVDGDLVWW